MGTGFLCSEIEKLGLLGLVAMPRTGVYMQFFQHGSTQGIAREHTFDGMSDHPLRHLGEQLLQADGLEIPDVTRVTMVHLVSELVAGYPHLFGIDNDDVVTRIHMGGIPRLVFAAQAPRELRGESAQGLALRIDQVPLAANLRRLDALSPHVRCSGTLSI